MEETYDPPYKYLWGKFMKEYLHEIKDASDLTNHLNKTRNFPFARNLPSDEVLSWKPNSVKPNISRYDEFFKGMIKHCPESKLSELAIYNYDDFVQKSVPNESKVYRALVLIDPSYTKIALQKCKRSGRYNVWSTKDGNELMRLKKGFETLTGLCSCYHIDSNPIVSNKCNVSKPNCYIYFAINIPVKEYSTLTLGQHNENYKFFYLSEILYSRKDISWFVKDNVKDIKNYCKNKSKIEFVKPLCKS